MTTLAFGWDRVPGAIAVDDTDVYWSDLVPSASSSSFVPRGTTILKVSISGGAITTFACFEHPGPTWSNDLAVDGTAVYWTNYDEETVTMKLE